jgi:ABC-2 type transport system ATP-binding protein
MAVGASMTDAIVASGLRKSYGQTKALDGIDLRIRKGSVFGMLGPNGAGKTTMIRVLSTLVRPDGGTATVLGHDVVREAREVRKRISLTGQYASIDEDLTGTENLVLVGRLIGMPWRDARERAGELLDAFGLAEAARRQVRTYSGGMRRRIDIAASLVATPEILFLDEPTTGLDPRSRLQVWDIVRQIASQGTTVLLTTQHLEEADRLAERLAVVDHGRVIAEGTSRDLKSSIGRSALHVRLQKGDDEKAAHAAIRKVVGDGILPSNEPGSIAVKVSQADDAGRILQALGAGGVRVSEFTLGNPSLDDVFFALTGRAAEAKGGTNGLSQGMGDAGTTRDTAKSMGTQSKPVTKAAMTGAPAGKAKRLSQVAANERSAGASKAVAKQGGAKPSKPPKGGKA